MTKRAFLAVLLTILAVMTFGQANAAPSTLSGLGEVTPPRCDQGAYKIPIVAASDGGPVWIAVRPASIGIWCSGIHYSLSSVFAGTWDPAKGGCIPGQMPADRWLCIGPVAQTSPVVATSLSLCFSLQPRDCWDGTATFIRT